LLTLARTRAALEAARAPGVQLAVVRRGELAEIALGKARRDVEMRPDSIALWMSSTEPLMPVALGQLAERGLLGFDDPVAAHLPEFAAAGKERISLRHLLTHTAGIPNAHKQWSHESWDEIIAKVCAAAPEPGHRLGVDCEYHVASAWYALGEIVRRRDGRAYGDYVREAIFAPLGTSDFWVGMSARDFTAQGKRIASPHEFWAFSGSREGLAVCRPGGSGWGTARALASFHAALARGGAPLLRRETLDSLTECALRGVADKCLGLTLNRALGFVLDSKEYGAGSAWYGPSCSPRAFGHAGFGSSVAFADPAHDLAVALAWNGFVTEEANRARTAPVLEGVYTDLGL
jgi:CubicO group peptidase (beta-lactamase class C family)